MFTSPRKSKLYHSTFTMTMAYRVRFVGCWIVLTSMALGYFYVKQTNWGEHSPMATVFRRFIVDRYHIPMGKLRSWDNISNLATDYSSNKDTTFQNVTSEDDMFTYSAYVDNDEISGESKRVLHVLAVVKKDSDKLNYTCVLWYLGPELSYEHVKLLHLEVLIDHHNKL